MSQSILSLALLKFFLLQKYAFNSNLRQTEIKAF